MKRKRWVIRKRDSDVTKVLIMARRRIKDPKHWAIGAFARDSQGHSVQAQNVTARQWCAVGSIYASAGEDTRLAVRTSNALHDASTVQSPYEYDRYRVMPGTYINDALGHDAVMDLYDQAIERSRQ